MAADYFKDKVVIVTGASSGIGLASARLFASRGAKVVMAARSYDKLLELAPTLCPDPERVLCVKTDVSKEEGEPITVSLNLAGDFGLDAVAGATR